MTWLISYFSSFCLIVSTVAPEKELTVAFIFSSLFLMPFNMELPTCNVVWFITFLGVSVRSTISELLSSLSEACEGRERFCFCLFSCFFCAVGFERRPFVCSHLMYYCCLIVD